MYDPAEVWRLCKSTKVKLDGAVDYGGTNCTSLRFHYSLKSMPTATSEIIKPRLQKRT